MSVLEPIDPFLRELRLAQATGQRVLAAAAQRHPAGALRRGPAQRADAGPITGRVTSPAGRAESRAD